MPKQVRPPKARKTSPLTVSRPELLVDGSDAEFRRLVHGLFGFFARHEAVRDGHAARIGLAGIEYTVLISIAHLSKNEDVSVKTVADHLHVSGTFITRVVNRLIKLGGVRKETLAKDRRRVRLSITPHGWALLEKLAPVQRQVNDIEFACISDVEFRAMIDVVERLIDSSDKAVALQHYLRSVE
jgi:MarR family transcriptional regulator, organic hydroperoxide resistance regulator